LRQASDGKYINRNIALQPQSELQAGKVLIIQGARRVAKTILVRNLLSTARN
jgi:predicted AAA+ superfamily ATPase